ncbi:MAG: ATP-binding protein, partial [Anaerolineales bacterium]|nr:ATP-binding protein [Anaerolineales bacterium]
AGGVAGGVLSGELSLATFSIAFLAGMLAGGVIPLFIGGRFIDSGLNWLQNKVSGSSGSSRMAWWPLSPLQTQVTDWLQQDPETGIANVNELLAYSLQFITVIRAVNAWLDQLQPEQIFPAVNLIVDHPYDWKLVQFCFTSLENALKYEFLDGLFIIPKRFKQRWAVSENFDLRLGTAVQKACAGFWLLQQKNIQLAAAAFYFTRELPYGEILYKSMAALSAGPEVRSLADVFQWAESTAWLAQDVAEEPLRPSVLATLNRLRTVAQEATIAYESISQLNRNAALGRAGATLAELIEDVEKTCAYPEWPLVKDIAEKWRTILAKAGGEIGEIVIQEPVRNPYIVGNPVKGKLFVGREAILQRLEELWGSDVTQSVPSVVLFGHRRMGKSSILQNLGVRFGTNTLIAQFTMQRLGKVSHTGELLHAFALAIFYAWEENFAGNHGKSLLEPNLDDYDSNAYTTFNRFLRAVQKTIGDQYRVILTIDEFELIEKGIQEGYIDREVLEFLRGLIHSEPWFILALAGLHTLEEMTADYWNPLFASVTPIHIRFLTPGASAQLLANPTSDFPLDFTRDTVNRVYHWVQGQPYLTQLVGHTLVRRYNQSVFEESKTREPRFTREDVDSVVMSTDFFEQGSYYFTGVWGQAEKSPVPGQTEILLHLAQEDDPANSLVITALQEQGQEALTVLEKHDVIKIESDRRVDFTVPLMRYWIREYKLKN